MKARQSILSPRAVALAAALALAFAPMAIFGQQQGVTAYEYDKNGRLVSVITPAGEKIDYEYDLSGNVVTVKRTAAVLAVFSFSPREGGAGDLITFIGFGFGPNIADNTVSFNGALAKIVSTS